MEMRTSKSHVEVEPADQVEHCILGLVACMGHTSLLKMTAAMCSSGKIWGLSFSSVGLLFSSHHQLTLEGLFAGT